MDTHTLELLEFDKIRALVAARAACSLGKEAARRMEPSRDPGEIREPPGADDRDGRGARVGPHAPVRRPARHPARRSAGRRSGPCSTPRSWPRPSRRSGRSATSIAGSAGSATSFPRLGGLKLQIGEFSGVANAIEGCLDSRGKILDTASRKLSAIRREIGQVEERIQETLRRMLRSPEMKRILRYPNFTMVGHHYVLPIAKEHRGEIQGSVHRTSASNETVFIEPQAIAEHSAQLSFLRAREAKEIRRILRWLSAQVGQVADSLLGSLETLAELDLIFARGRYSLDYRMSPPDFNQEGKLVLRGARHPLLEALFRDEPALPRARAPGEPAGTRRRRRRSSDPPPPPAAAPPSRGPSCRSTCTSASGSQILVVTGPNTGGKTVALKTVGLLAVMAQSGLHIPAHQGSQLPVFDDVLADIGDEQSLEQSLSTFSSHIRRVSEILARGDRAVARPARRAGGRDRPRRRGRARPGDPRRARQPRLPGDRHDPHRRPEDLRLLEPPGRERGGRVRPGDAPAAIPAPHRRHRPVERAADRPAARPARAPRRPGAALPGADPGRAHPRAGDRAEAPQGRRGGAAGGPRRPGRGRAEPRGAAPAARRPPAPGREDARLVEARARLQPGDRVVVPRFGYDRPGRIVKLDPRKKTAVVAIGQMQWNVPIDELIPQVLRTPEVPETAKPKAVAAKSALRLEDFPDEPAARLIR